MKNLTPEQVQRATKSPLVNIQKVLPSIYAAIKNSNSPTDAYLVAVLATAAVECNFAPVIEHGAVAYFKMYEGRHDLGNTQKGDGFLFRGRGLVQLTGRANYTKYGKMIGVDLVGNPDLALIPDNAVKLLIAYMKTHGCDVWANRGDWQKVRRQVNGGLNGWPRFHDCVYKLLDEVHKIT